MLLPTAALFINIFLIIYYCLIEKIIYWHLLFHFMRYIPIALLCLASCAAPNQSVVQAAPPAVIISYSPATEEDIAASFDAMDDEKRITRHGYRMSFPVYYALQQVAQVDAGYSKVVCLGNRGFFIKQQRPGEGKLQKILKEADNDRDKTIDTAEAAHTFYQRILKTCKK
jgi:hypothetical protein